MNLDHDFRTLSPLESGYRWNRRNRRCRFCNIDEDHAYTDRCVVLAARLAGGDAVKTALDEVGYR